MRHVSAFGELLRAIPEIEGYKQILWDLLPGQGPYHQRQAFVAQLDRALASEAKGCGFDPRRTQMPESPLDYCGLTVQFSANQIDGILF